MEYVNLKVWARSLHLGHIHSLHTYIHKLTMFDLPHLDNAIFKTQIIDRIMWQLFDRLKAKATGTDVGLENCSQGFLTTYKSSYQFIVTLGD